MPLFFRRWSLLINIAILVITIQIKFKKMTEQLIELVREHAFLYDTSCKSYKNVGLKDETWKNIGNKLNENDEVLKKKWKSIRDNYLRYKKEINGTTGQATKKYLNWPWASQLQFLDKFLAPRQTKSNIITNFPFEIQIQELTSPSQITSPPQASTSIFEVKESDGLQVYTLTDSTLPAPKKIKTNSQEPNNQPVGVDKLIGYLENKMEHTYDSVDHLFLSYAGTFKKFSERNQIEVKVELAKLFADMELKELDELGTSSSLSLHTPMSNYSNDSDFSQSKSSAFQNVMSSSKNCSTVE